MYALGRNVQYYDEPSVRQIVRAAKGDATKGTKDKSYAFLALVEEVVKTPAFQMREAN
jgi:hypothetical protein